MKGGIVTGLINKKAMQNDFRRVRFEDLCISSDDEILHRLEQENEAVERRRSR